MRLDLATDAIAADSPVDPTTGGDAAAAEANARAAAAEAEAALAAAAEAAAASSATTTPAASPAVVGTDDSAASAADEGSAATAVATTAEGAEGGDGAAGAEGEPAEAEPPLVVRRDTPWAPPQPGLEAGMGHLGLEDDDDDGDDDGEGDGDGDELPSPELDDGPESGGDDDDEEEGEEVILESDPETDPYERAAADEAKYETLQLKVVHERGRTGFEEQKDFPIRINSLIAARYQGRVGRAPAHTPHGRTSSSPRSFSPTGTRCASTWVPRRSRRRCSASTCTPASRCASRSSRTTRTSSTRASTRSSCCGTGRVSDSARAPHAQPHNHTTHPAPPSRYRRYIKRHDELDAHNVLHMHDFFYHKEHLFIVCELLRDNLYEFSKFNREEASEPYFTLPRLRRISRQCLAALRYIHSLNLIHCDLKPENILIKSYSRCEVKVIDFGSSCFTSDHLSSYVQSRSYRAPEVILGMAYDHKIDIWSLGAIVAELLTGVVLFQNDSVASMLARIAGIVGPFPPEMLSRGRHAHKYFIDGVVYERDAETGSTFLLQPKGTSLRHRLDTDDELFLSFVGSLLCLNPDDRPTAEQALQHPWIATDPYGPGAVSDALAT